MCHYKRAVGLLCGLGKACIEHRYSGFFGVVFDEIGQLLFQTVGINVMLYHQQYKRVLLFFILVDNYDWLDIVGHFCHNKRGFMGRIGYISEEFFNLCFCFVDVNVAYNNDALMVRVIPFAVIVDEFLAFEVVDN